MLRFVKGVGEMPIPGSQELVALPGSDAPTSDQGGSRKKITRKYSDSEYIAEGMEIWQQDKFVHFVY